MPFSQLELILTGLVLILASLSIVLWVRLLKIKLKNQELTTQLRNTQTELSGTKRELESLPRLIGDLQKISEGQRTNSFFVCMMDHQRVEWLAFSYTENGNVRRAFSILGQLTSQSGQVNYLEALLTLMQNSRKPVVLRNAPVENSAIFYYCPTHYCLSRSIEKTCSGKTLALPLSSSLIDVRNKIGKILQR